MKFYYSPAACSLGTHITLLESGLTFEALKVDLKTKTTSEGDYTQVNPKAYVPALVLDEGPVMSEGVAIMQWVADQVPEKHLIHPWGTQERYKDIEWLNFLATEVHKGFANLWKKDAPVQIKEEARSRLGARFLILANALESTDYLTGSDFTVMDAYLFTLLRWTSVTGINLNEWPRLVTYCEKIQTRPAVQKALLAEGLI